MVVPSSDCNGNNILVALHYDASTSHRRYMGVVYTAEGDIFDTVDVGDIWDKFDFENSLPLNIEEVMLRYKEFYPSRFSLDDDVRVVRRSRYFIYFPHQNYNHL